MLLGGTLQAIVALDAHSLGSWILLALCVFVGKAYTIVFFPRGSSFGYLAAVVLPLNLPYRDVYVAFNFEANYGLPSNDSYNDWIDRWDLDTQNLGIGNNVTAINGRGRRHFNHSTTPLDPRSQLLYTRSAFYRFFTSYMAHFGLNGTACLLRTICDVASSNLHENNGLLGGIFKILFMPSTTAPELEAVNRFDDAYEAEFWGTLDACAAYENWCPGGFIDMISQVLEF